MELIGANYIVYQLSGHFFSHLVLVLFVTASVVVVVIVVVVFVIWQAHITTFVESDEGFAKFGKFLLEIRQTIRIGSIHVDLANRRFAQIPNAIRLWHMTVCSRLLLLILFAIINVIFLVQQLGLIGLLEQTRRTTSDARATRSSVETYLGLVLVEHDAGKKTVKVDFVQNAKGNECGHEKAFRVRAHQEMHIARLGRVVQVD